MRKKTIRIHCNVCGMRIIDSFQSKLRHALRKHPEIALKDLVGKGEQGLFEMGFKLGETLKRQSGSSFLD